jgi:hypothetical protein
MREGLGNWCRELGRVFQLAVEEESVIGEFFRREAEGGAKEDLGRPALGLGPSRPHPGPCLFGGSGRWRGLPRRYGAIQPGTGVVVESMAPVIAQMSPCCARGGATSQTLKHPLTFGVAQRG